MANEYFQPGSVPAPSSPGASAVIRNEFSAIGNAFDKLPILAGHANEVVSVNATGTKLVTTGFLTTDFITDDGTFTLTNKTISWASNIFPGFGTGATKVAGTGADNVLLLSEANKLPALDGSLLTNLSQANIGTVEIEHGGTGATDLAGAQTNLGIDLKADAFDAVLTGAPTAPTPPTGDNSARIATTYFVTNTIGAIGSFAPSNNAPKMNGVVSAGVGTLGSRDDHVHPTDTTRAPLASPTFTGVPAAPTAAANTNTTQLATTAFVLGQAANSTPLMNGTAAVGTSVAYARGDHSHPTDTTRAPLASPTFTGVPAAPTPATSTNTTQLATTAFVQSLLAQQPPAGMQPSDTNPVMNGTVSPGVGVEGSRYDHRHPSDTSRLPVAGGTMTGVLSVLGGTSLLPGLAFAGDTNTGVFSNVADNIAFTTEGVERMRINNLGQIALNGATSGETDFNWSGSTYVTTNGFKTSVWINRTIQPDVTGGYFGFRSRLTTQAAAFTVPLARHFYCDISTLGAGSAITEMRGFDATFGTGPDASTGFYANVPSGANNFNFLAVSGAANQFNGETWIGRTSPGNGPTLNIGPDYTGSYGPTSVPRLRINSTTNGATVGLGRWSNDATGTNYAGFKSRGATIGAEGAVQSGDVLCILTGAGSDGVAASGTQAQINLSAAENWAAGSHGTVIEARTTPLGATVPQVVMQWTAGRRSHAAGDLSSAGTLLTAQIPSSSLTTASTLSAAALRNGIILTAPASASINLTLSTGTLLDANFSEAIPNNQSFEWSVINTHATNAAAVVAGTGHTVVGNMSVAGATSARFMTRKTATNTFVTYRIA